MSTRWKKLDLLRDGLGPLLCLSTALSLLSPMQVRASEPTLATEERPWPAFSDARMEIAGMDAGAFAAVAPEPDKAEPAADEEAGSAVEGLSFSDARMEIAIGFGSGEAQEEGILLAGPPEREISPAERLAEAAAQPTSPVTPAPVPAEGRAPFLEAEPSTIGERAADPRDIPKADAVPPMTASGAPPAVEPAPASPTPGEAAPRSTAAPSPTAAAPVPAVASPSAEAALPPIAKRAPAGPRDDFPTDPASAPQGQRAAAPAQVDAAKPTAAGPVLPATAPAVSGTAPTGAAKAAVAPPAEAPAAGTPPAPSAPKRAKSARAAPDGSPQLHVQDAAHPEPDYYGQRARSVLKDESAVPLDGGPKVEGFPGHNIVVCVGGCAVRKDFRKEDVGVVFAARKPAADATVGEMIPTAAAADAPPAPVAPAIECMAGCYDDTPRRHRSPPIAEMHRKVQAAAAIAAGRLGAVPARAETPVDWEAELKAGLPKPGTKAKAPARERSGEWFTRIERSRGTGE